MLCLECDRLGIEGLFTPTEVRLSKADGARLWRAKATPAFHARLDEWARRMAADGYEIRSEPEPGPGTMVWKAVKK